MPRKKNDEPTVSINLTVSISHKLLLDKELADEDGKISQGAYRKWFERKLNQHFKIANANKGNKSG